MKDVSTLLHVSGFVLLRKSGDSPDEMICIFPLLDRKKKNEIKEREANRQMNIESKIDKRRLQYINSIYIFNFSRWE